MTSLIAETTTTPKTEFSPPSSMYDCGDLAICPERFTVDLNDPCELSPEFLPQRGALLANKELVARIRTYVMHGDPVADAYAALIPEYGFGRLASMLEAACEHGVKSPLSAPPELGRLIHEMEQFPSWLDAKLIEEGARLERNAYAHRAPYIIRGAFIGTFMNKYSALPMALTGALSNKTAARRIKETATFFTTSVLPGALGRHGIGFRAAAMVRLMHSVVRFNVLTRGAHWDLKIYGLPIPQIDQMPVALMTSFSLALQAVRCGRTTFTPAERARVELGRYRGFLLGLPRELLAETPQGVFTIMLTRYATLRKGFDETCAALVAATMAADLMPDSLFGSRVKSWMERGLSKTFFVKRTMRGDRRAAAAVGVRLSAADKLASAVAAIVVAWNMNVYELAARIPAVRGAADRRLVRKLTRQLARYGHAEFRTNPEKYRPVTAKSTTPPEAA